MDTPKFVYTIYVQAAPDRVYRALTDRALLDVYMEASTSSTRSPGSA